MKYRSHKRVAENRESQVRLGQSLRDIRKAAGMSQVEMAKLINVDQSAYSRIETGEQGITLWQLIKFSENFGVPIDSMARGTVNIWKVATDAGQPAPFPERYLIHPHSRVRELLPVMAFVNVTQGHQAGKDLLDELKLEGILSTAAEQSIGVYAMIDMMKAVISKNYLNKANFKRLIDQTRLKESNDFLHEVYATQRNPLLLIRSRIDNAHHYQTNFLYTLESCTADSMDVSIKPAPHMAEVDYRDSVLEDVFCRLQKEQLSQFPRYINEKPAKLVEHECMFQGAHRCIYSIQIAS